MPTFSIHGPAIFDHPLLAASGLSGPDVMEPYVRKPLTFLIVLDAIVLGVCSPASAQTNIVGGGLWGDAKPHGSCTALTLDGSVTQNVTASSSLTLALTTTAGSGVIVVSAVVQAGQLISSVTATGLTFSQRPISQFVGSGGTIQNFETPYTVNFSENITVNLNSSTFATVTAFGIGNAATSSSFDPNVSLPATQFTGAISGTTSNANDFVWANGVTSNSNPSPDAGWTSANGSNFQLVEYKTVSSTGTFTATSTLNGAILDAVKRPC
jgi:hypothetical protein